MAPFVAGPVQVRTPASSANLGPGFDAFGLALALHDVLTGEVVEDGAPLVITAVGEGAAEVPLDERHLVHRAMVLAFRALGVEPPRLRLDCHNVIPHGRGLGSSSAAIVGGLVLARELVADGPQRLDDATVLGLAADLEGHPDNVAAALYGGFTIAFGEPGGYDAVRLEVLPATRFVVLVPDTPVATTVARGLLPELVTHADAVRNAGRAALLVAALTARPEHLMAATEDRLHQGFRAPAMPDSAALVERLREQGHAAVISGAGPTVLAMVTAEGVDAVRALAPVGWRVLELPVDALGARSVS